MQLYYGAMPTYFYEFSTRTWKMDCASRAIKRIPRGPCSSRREAYNDNVFRIKTFRSPTLAYNVS